MNNKNRNKLTTASALALVAFVVFVGLLVRELMSIKDLIDLKKLIPAIDDSMSDTQIALINKLNTMVNMFWAYFVFIALCVMSSAIYLTMLNLKQKKQGQDLTSINKKCFLNNLVAIVCAVGLLVIVIMLTVQIATTVKFIEDNSGSSVQDLKFETVSYVIGVAVVGLVLLIASLVANNKENKASINTNNNSMNTNSNPY